MDIDGPSDWSTFASTSQAREVSNDIKTWVFLEGGQQLMSISTTYDARPMTVITCVRERRGAHTL